VRGGGGGPDGGGAKASMRNILGGGGGGSDLPDASAISRRRLPHAHRNASDVGWDIAFGGGDGGGSGGVYTNAMATAAGHTPHSASARAKAQALDGAAADGSGSSGFEVANPMAASRAQVSSNGSRKHARMSQSVLAGVPQASAAAPST
jgi:hypothetical protein